MSIKKEKKERIKLKKGEERIFEKCIARAKKMMPNKKKISKCIRKARKIIDRLHNIPKFDALTNNICSFCDLVSDYLDGEYNKLPLSTIVTVFGGILYVVLPFDFIADFLPVIGWVDDTAVLACIALAEQNDVKEYLEWKKSTESNDANCVDK